MKTPKLYLVSLASTAGVIFYISFVAWLMTNLGGWIDVPNQKLIGPLIFLTLFVLSATVVGSLVLGYPIWLYFENKKKDAVRLFGYNVVFLFLMLVLLVALAAVSLPKWQLD
ncbi:hypothetical protein HZC53_02965 [Candidatus Uhrbacteria bacterium]|nr:hypothetical protein [Candidatus Uhrbacteria bacterium]